MRITLPLPSPRCFPPAPTKPQLHTHAHHNTYNGTSDLPLSISVKRGTSASAYPFPRCHVYTVTLHYANNRACNIIRTHNDFVALERGLPIRGPFAEPGDKVIVPDLQKFLEEAVGKCKGECALEWFLRRRMGDCGY